MSPLLIASLIVLVIIAVLALYGWLETLRLLDRQLGASDEQLAEEHARPHGNVVTLHPVAGTAELELEEDA